MSTNTQEPVRMLVYSAQEYDVDAIKEFESQYRELGVELSFVESELTSGTAGLAKGHRVVCLFVNDEANGETVRQLQAGGTELIVMRCAGFDRVDLGACRETGISIARVPAYSPRAVAEHAVLLALALNRRLPQAMQHNAAGQFALTRELLGFDMAGRVVGLLGTGAIGQAAARIFLGFGCRLMCYDAYPNAALAQTPNVSYAPLKDVLANADIVSLHMPLMPSTRHIIDAASLAAMKPGAILINTSRGALVDSEAVLEAVASGHIRGAGLDVYEHEAKYFFHSHPRIEDPVLRALANSPNIILTAHQAFFTREALHEISATTLLNVSEFLKDGKRMKDMTNSIYKVA